MTTPHTPGETHETLTNLLNLETLPNLGRLYQLLTSGKHLNRLAEPALWAELENEQDTYTSLFVALGYDFRIDGRGFAWLHTREGTSNMSKRTRHLALLFLTLFEYQSDAGKPLRRFTEWIIDKALLTALQEKYGALLEAEELHEDGLQKLMKTAVDFGFAQSDQGIWRLLPAVHRYLDHFESLALERPDDLSEWIDAQHDAETDSPAPDSTDEETT
jgi:hypothetical protein